MKKLQKNHLLQKKHLLEKKLLLKSETLRHLDFMAVTGGKNEEAAAMCYPRTECFAECTLTYELEND